MIIMALYFADLTVNILTQVCVYQSKQSCLIIKMTQICILAIATQTQRQEIFMTKIFAPDSFIQGNCS